MNIAEKNEGAAERDNDLGGGCVADVDPDEVRDGEVEAVTFSLTSGDTHIHHLFTKNLLNTFCFAACCLFMTFEDMWPNFTATDHCV